MEFLNFGMAFFAAAAAVPVILHLIMRQNPKHVIFPALRFVRQRNEANRRRLQLRHLILLALRALALVVLAFALARLTLTSTGAFVSQVAVERHRKGANYLFVDGHVELMPWSKVLQKLQQTGERFVRPDGNT